LSKKISTGGSQEPCGPWHPDKALERVKNPQLANNNVSLDRYTHILGYSNNFTKKTSNFLLHSKNASKLLSMEKTIFVK
jgi:hypothetical protein